MKLYGDIKINGRNYPKGSEISPYQIYPFFLIHMLMFGGSGFLMAYASDDVPTFALFLHGGFAILIYTVFYVVIFGWDEVRWMFINAVLGLYGMWCEIGWLLGLFGKNLSDFPWYRHIVPFGYYVLYTFLLRHLWLDVFKAREDPARQQRFEMAYIVFFAVAYSLFYLFHRHVA